MLAILDLPVSLQEEKYDLALKAIEKIDEDLTQGQGHYWTKEGELLTTLDQVVCAVLSDNLLYNV